MHLNEFADPKIYALPADVCSRPQPVETWLTWLEDENGIPPSEKAAE